MSIKYLSLVCIAATFAISACTKEAQQPVPSKSGQSASAVSYPIVGRWQETKVVTYLQDPSGNKLNDTTYLQPFTAADYALFNNDGSCSVSIDHYYFQTIPGNQPPQAIPQLVSSYVYKAVGSTYSMESKFIAQGPGGGSSTNTISMPDSHTLLIHSVAFGIGPNALITDSYYTNK